jgi:hypothetical protein
LVGIGAAAVAESYDVAVQFYFRDRHGNITIGDLDTQYSGSGVYTNKSEITLLAQQEIAVWFYAPVKGYSGSGVGGVTTKWAQNTAFVSAPPDYVLCPDDNVYQCIVGHTSSNSGTLLDDFNTDLKAGNWRLYWENDPGWQNHYAISSASQLNVNTVTLEPNSTLEVGDYTYIEPPLAYQQEIAISARNAGHPTPIWEYWREVTAVGVNTFTFDGDPSDILPGQLFSGGLMVLIWVRENTGVNIWKLAAENPVLGSSIVQSVTVDRDGSLAILDVPLLIRETPPKGTINHIFQDLLFITGNDESKNTIFWSTAGESVETFNTGTFAVIVGEARDGVITGLDSFNDILIILCERAVYFASGTFGTSQIRVWKVKGSEAGCSSHSSVQNIEGDLMYLGDKGVFSVSQGGGPSEIGWKVNNLITDDIVNLDISAAVSAHDRVNQLYILHIPAAVVSDSITLVYDYRYQVWLKHKGMDMKGGVAKVGKTLYFVDSTPDLQKEQAAYSDNGVAIDAYYYSDWDHLGDPGVDKRYLNLRVFVLDNSSVYDLKIQTDEDWGRTTNKTNATVAIDAYDKNTIKHKIHSINAQAMRFKLSNNVLNEPLHITKYELEYELIQKRMKK